MIPPSTIAAALLSALALCGAGLHVLALARLRRHLARREPAPAETPPVTHWRAVKRGVPALEEKLVAWVESGRETDQFLIGVDAGSPDAHVAGAVMERYPQHEIRVISCEPNRARNPKISKFIQMAPHARHGCWMFTDSEALLDRSFVESFREEWSGWDALTAGYRFTGVRTLMQALDTAPPLLTLWPGLMLRGRVDFTLGACTGVRAPHVQEFGGWEVFSGALAEDRELGAKIAANGHRLGLSRHLLAIESDRLSVWSWLKHQHRVAVTYRVAAPVGALGLPILQALPLALAAGIVGGGWWWLPLLVAYVVRMAVAFAMARGLNFPLPALPLVVLLVPLIEFVGWVLAWLPLPVWWSGKWRWLK
jgi:hypothetical protein